VDRVERRGNNSAGSGAAAAVRGVVVGGEDNDDGGEGEGNNKDADAGNIPNAAAGVALPCENLAAAAATLGFAFPKATWDPLRLPKYPMDPSSSSSSSHRRSYYYYYCCQRGLLLPAF